MYNEIDQVMMSYMPTDVKEAITTFNTHKLAEHALGLDEITFAKVAAYMAQKVAERQARWRGIGDGLLALHALEKQAVTNTAPPFNPQLPGWAPPAGSRK